MEEKIYFEPEKSGTKKDTKQKPKKKKDRRFLKLFFFLLFLLIVILIIIWLLKGSTTTSGQFPANVRSESLVCETKDIIYEKVNKVEPKDKNLKISMVFFGEDSLSSATLEYTMGFDSKEEAHSAEAVSHAQFNLGLQALGYDASKFNNKFSEIDEKLIITLSIPTKKEIDDLTRSYFLINQKNNKSPIAISEYRQNYEQQGFSCVSTQNNK